MPPQRDQADIGLVDQPIDCSNSPNNPDVARQEFKDEADINYVLSRLGVTAPRGTPTYGEWDDTIDLQQAIAAVREADAAFNKLPRELKQKFPNMNEIIRAVDNGSLVIKETDETPVTPVPPTP